MGSLLDKVLSNKDNPGAELSLSPMDDKPHTMKDGSVIYDSTIAALNRILEVNPKLYKRVEKTGVVLYNGNKRIDISVPATMVILVRGDWRPASEWQAALLRELVVEYAPELTLDQYMVTDDLIWDKNEAKLKRITEKDNIRTAI